MNYIIIANFGIFWLIFAVGPGCVPWTAGIEFVQTQYKMGTAALSACVNFGFTFLVALLFPILEENIEFYVFLIFSGFTAVAVVFLWKKVPESKGKEPGLIQEELKEMWN